MDAIKDKLLEIRKTKGFVDFTDLDEAVGQSELNDDQIDQLIVWINQNDLNISLHQQTKLNDPYFQEISVYPLLSKEEEYQLAKQVQQHDPIARDRFIKANLRLVIEVAKNYTTSQLTFNDLIQEGNIGLLKAVDKYDPDKGVRFSAYGIYWIRKAILEAINKSQLIAIPQKVYEQLNRITQIQEDYRQKYNTEATAEQIAKEMNLPAERVLQLLSYQINIRSLDEVALSKQDKLFELVSLDDADPLATLHLHELMRTLPERDRQVLQLYYGLNGNSPHTLQQIAEQMGLTKQRISQIIKNAIAYMKENYDQ